MNLEVQDNSSNQLGLQVSLEECLKTADELQLSIIAAKISEALDRFQSPDADLS